MTMNDNARPVVSMGGWPAQLRLCPGSSLKIPERGLPSLPDARRQLSSNGDNSTGGA